ncbi:MAG: hypothetical protein HY899_09400 [Deltaproteobacteria bacterium]|nr:hypothetical protein [Deltaproteobacteria bacterium]
MRDAATAATTPVRVAEDTLENRLLPSLSQRARLGMLFFCTASALLIVGDARRGGENVVAVVCLQFLRFVVFGAAAAYFSRPREDGVATRVTLGLVAMLAGTAAMIGPLRGDFTPLVVISMATAFGCAALLPWGAWAQATAVAILSTAVVINGLRVEGLWGTVVTPNSVFAYCVSMAGSVYLAALEARRRRAAAEALIEVRRADSGLRGLNDALERRVAERTIDLARANRDLEASNLNLVVANRNLEEAYRELEGFTHSVSHDLRVPLRVINGLSQLALEECGGVLDEAGRGYLVRIAQSAVRVGVVGDDLLTLARVTRAPMVAEEVDMSAIARELLAERRAAEPARRVDVSIADGLRTHGDPRLLRIALGHLIANAWKFTWERDPARIEIGEVLADGQRGVFVRDDGIGFATELSGKLFGRFERLHDQSELKGTGIGLAIVQRIVRRHGGRVWAEGQPGKGATFRLCLPAAGSEGNAAPHHVVVTPD